MNRRRRVQATRDLEFVLQSLEIARPAPCRSEHLDDDRAPVGKTDCTIKRRSGVCLKRLFDPVFWRPPHSRELPEPDEGSISRTQVRQEPDAQARTRPP